MATVPANATGAVSWSGVVRFSDGTALNGALLRVVTGNSCSSGGTRVQDVYTDSTGAFTANVAAGVYTIQVGYSPPPGSNQPGSIYCLPGVDMTSNRTDDLNLPLTHLHLAVTDTDGNPVGGALVHLNDLGQAPAADVSLNPNLPTATGVTVTHSDVTTGPDGTVDIAWAPLRSTTTATVSPPDGRDLVATTFDTSNMSTDTTRTAELSHGFSWSGVVRFSDGTALNGALLRVVTGNSCSSGGTRVQDVYTDSTGAFTANVAAGVYSIQVGYSPPPGSNQPGSIYCLPGVDMTSNRTDDLNLPLTHLHLAVTDTDGNPVGGALVHLNDLGQAPAADVSLNPNLPTATGVTVTHSDVTTGPDGTVDIAWAPLRSTTTATVSPPDGRDLVATTFDTSNMSTDTTRTAELSHGFSWSGVVRFSDGTALNGALLRVVTGNSCSSGGTRVQDVYTDSTGAFTANVAAGVYSIQVGYSPPPGSNQPGSIYCLPGVDMTSNRTDDLNLPLTHLHLAVTDTDGNPVGGALVHLNDLGQAPAADVSLNPNLPTATGVTVTHSDVTTGPDGTVDIAWAPLRSTTTATVSPPDGRDLVATTFDTSNMSTDTTRTAELYLFGGVMVDQAGLPLPHQNVAVASGGAGVSTTTDDSGRFGVTTPPGTYDVAISGSIGDPTTYAVSVRHVNLTRPVTSQLTLPDRKIHISVEDQSGNSVAAADIHMACSSTSFSLLGGKAQGTQCAEEVTDHDGRAVLTLLPGAKSTLTVAPPADSGLRSATTTVAPTNTTSIRVMLQSASTGPSVGSLSSHSGPSSGGTRVTIAGEHLTGSTQVTFGGTPSPRVRLLSDTKVMAIAPPHPRGTVDVVVVTSQGSSASTPADRFTFQ